MAEYTRPATWDDVRHLATLLQAEGTRWALIGGYAIAAHGFVRFSEDIDILVEPSKENTQRWIRGWGEVAVVGASRFAPDEGGHADKDRADAAVLKAALAARRLERT